MIDAAVGKDVIKRGIEENFLSKLADSGMSADKIAKFDGSLDARPDGIEVVDQLDSPSIIAGVKTLDSGGLETVLATIPERVIGQLQSELLLKLHPEVAKIDAEQLPSIGNLPELAKEKAVTDYEEIREIIGGAGREGSNYIECLNRGDVLKEVDNYGTEMLFESADGKQIKIVFKTGEELRKRLIVDSSKPESMISGSCFMTKEVWENLVKPYFGFKSMAEAASCELLPDETTLVYYGMETYYQFYVD